MDSGDAGDSDRSVAYGDGAELSIALRLLKKDPSRRVTLVVGSGVTCDVVPGVEEMVKSFRDMLGDDAEASAKFDDAVQGAAAAERYQAAAAFVQRIAGPGSTERALRRAVAKAIADGSRPADIDDLPEVELEKLEFKPEIWNLPPAVEAIGMLAAAHPDRVRLVITTNFDPLIEVAIRKAGREAMTTTLTRDGNPLQTLQGKNTRVVHIHGYWRGRLETLHTPGQLKKARMVLRSWLTDVLADDVVVIVGYAGWSDAFMTTLQDALQDDRKVHRVLWAAHEAQEDVLPHVKRFLEQFASGQVAAFAGVDAATVLPRWSRDWAPAHVPAPAPPPAPAPATAPAPSASPKPPPPPPAPAKTSPLVAVEGLRAPATATEPAITDASSPWTGWSQIDPSFLWSLAELSDDELAHYFDGRRPNWRDARSARVPRRGVVGSIVDTLERAHRSNAGPQMFLIRGPGGEGKSTILRQVAADLGASDARWSILFREKDEPLGKLEALPPGQGPWLIVSDDADRLLPELETWIRRLNDVGRRGVHVLLAARTMDWIDAGGEAAEWSGSAEYHPEFVRGLNEADAAAIVHAWSRLPDRGLRELAELPDEASRVRALVEAARQEASRDSNEGAFLGAMLTVRIGRGLRDHVKSLLAYLDGQPLAGTSSLASAYLRIAALHFERVTAMTVDLLARSLGAPASDLGTKVLLHLRDEVSVVSGGNYILVRHRRIAEVALDVAADLDFDVKAAYASCVVAAVALSAQAYHQSKPLRDVSRLGTLISDSPRIADDPQRKSLAIACARAAAEADETDIVRATDLSRVLRRCEQPELAFDECYSSVTQYWPKYPSEMKGRYGRNLFTEWSIAAGACGHRVLATWFALFTLSDNLPGELTARDVEVIAVNLGLTLIKLRESQPTPEVTRGVAAATALLDAFPCSVETAKHRDRYHDVLKAAGAAPVVPQDAGRALQEALTALWPRREWDECPPPLAPPAQLRFNGFVQLVKQYSRRVAGSA